MADEATRTVLFADVSGSTQLYESAGDEAAAKAIAQCMRTLRKVTESAGGEVVKEIGDEVMTTFATADAAANAATRMHLAVEALPLVGATKLASRIAGQAARGQVLLSEGTVALLSPALRSFTRALYAVELKGKAESVALCELVWRQSPDVTDMAGTTVDMAVGQLWLKHRGAEVTGWDAIVQIGRDKECHVIVASENASRQHCTIERRREKFVLRDHSTNGTYLTVEGEQELLLQREEYVLRGHGWISCGEPHSLATDPLEYYCE